MALACLYHSRKSLVSVAHANIRSWLVYISIHLSSLFTLTLTPTLQELAGGYRRLHLTDYLMHPLSPSPIPHTLLTSHAKIKTKNKEEKTHITAGLAGDHPHYVAVGRLGEASWTTSDHTDRS